MLGLPASALRSVHGGDGAPRPRLAFVCVCLPRLTQTARGGPCTCRLCQGGDAQPAAENKCGHQQWLGWKAGCVASQSLACQTQGLCPAAPRHTGVREVPTPASEGLQSHLRDKESAASPVGRVHVSTKDSAEAANRALSAQVADNEG